MRKEYSRNNKIALYGTAKVISDTEAILNTLDGLEGELVRYRLKNEGEIRLIIQEALDRNNIKASILVDGNTVYPYQKIVREYEKLKKRGTLEKMSNAFYKFLHLNFDIAHYDKENYICHYNNDFATLKKAVLDKATNPDWKTDVQRILDHIQGKNIEIAA